MCSCLDRKAPPVLHRLPRRLYRKVTVSSGLSLPNLHLWYTSLGTVNTVTTLEFNVPTELVEQVLKPALLTDSRRAAEAAQISRRGRR